MDKKASEDLRFTLDFIAEIKKSEFIRNNSQESPISPRMNEPTVYSEEEEESILSFCN